MLSVHDAVANEKPTEQQDFSDEKQPHADFGGVELLHHFGEMVLQERRVLVLSLCVRNLGTHDG